MECGIMLIVITNWKENSRKKKLKKTKKKDEKNPGKRKN